MPRRLLIVTLGVLAAATAGLGPATASEGPRAGTDERDCVETGVPRAVRTSDLRALVPDRYTLSPVSASASRFFVITYTCQGVGVAGSLPHEPDGGPTTVTIATAEVTQRDDRALPEGQRGYIIWYGTDDLELFTELRRVGLPASYVPRSSATVGADGDEVTWSIRGAGLDYDQTATLVTPDTNGPRDSTVVFWHDGPHGDLRVTYVNRQLEEGLASVNADFRSNETLLDIIAQESSLQITNPGARFSFVEGSWTSTVETMSAASPG